MSDLWRLTSASADVIFACEGSAGTLHPEPWTQAPDARAPDDAPCQVVQKRMIWAQHGELHRLPSEL